MNQVDNASPDKTEPSEASQVINYLMPEDFDWEKLVTDHPIPALLLAATGGFVLGRSRGQLVLGALATFAASQVSMHVNNFIGSDLI